MHLSLRPPETWKQTSARLKEARLHASGSKKQANDPGYWRAPAAGEPRDVSSIECKTVGSHRASEAAALACSGLARLVLGPAVEVGVAEGLCIALLVSRCRIASCAPSIVGLHQLL